jgi:hypothetical protein
MNENPCGEERSAGTITMGGDMRKMAKGIAETAATQLRVA